MPLLLFVGDAVRGNIPLAAALPPSGKRIEDGAILSHHTGRDGDGHDGREAREEKTLRRNRRAQNTEEHGGWEAKTALPYPTLFRMG